MPDPITASPLSTRLRRLPGQFLLALVNATSILVILAAILALVAVDRLENAAARASAAIGKTMLAQLSVEPAALVQDLKGLRTDLAAYREAAGERRDAVAARLDERLAALDGQLDVLQSDIRDLAQSKRQLTGDAIRQAGAGLTEAVGGLLACRAPAAAAAARPATE